MADLYERLRRFQKNTTQGTGSEPSLPASSPPSSLPEALRNIPGLTRARDLVALAEKRDREKNRFLESIGVLESTNSAGSFGRRESTIPPDEIPYPPDAICGSGLTLLCRDSTLLTCHPEEILFLDTETTGLAGGTGTVPFLIGTGFYRNGFFTVRQFFMRDYDEEPAVLDELNRMLNEFAVIATYNGKSFDIPLLHTRFLLNRIRTPIREMPHADLLHPVRRFWREMLPDCTLLQVESYLKGETRHEDIPGELIPIAYFDFLRGLRLPRMRPVFLHNADDLFTLALIVSRLCQMVCTPLPETLHCREIAAIGRCHAAMDDGQNACRYLEIAIQTADSSEPNRLAWCKELSTYYKRMERWEEACALWMRITMDSHDPFPHIELAKYYEHKIRDIAQARHHAQIALSFIQPNSEAGYLGEEDPAQMDSPVHSLLHRLNRLSRKENNNKKKDSSIQ